MSRRFCFSQFFRRLSSLGLAAALCAAVSTGAFAQTLEKALEAYDFEEYQNAAQWLRPFADKGNAEAQYRMGKMYEGGRGVEQSSVQAKQWFQKAAAQGHVGARRRLEALEGKPSKASGESVALKWYQDKADEGDPDAQFNLGFMYETGFSIPRDDGRAAQWYELAAAKRNVPAQLRLGLMYLAGAGVKQSEIQAVKWIESAAERGNKLAIAVETMLIQSNQELLLDKPVIAERVRAISAKDEARAIAVLTSAIQEARVKFEREKRERDALSAKRRGIESAMNQDEDIEFGLDAQGRRTIAWYKRQAEHGSAMAQFQLGKYHELGQETPVDMPEAMRWYDMAAQQGYPDAQFYLGMLTLYGIGVEPNEVLGQSLIKAAAGQGHADARRALDKLGATPALQHFSMATWWLTRYGQDQNGLSLQHAGSLFDQGRGVPVDRAEAQRLIQKGAALGTKRAELSEIVPPPSETTEGVEPSGQVPASQGAPSSARATAGSQQDAESEPAQGTPMATRLALFAAIAAVPVVIFFRMYAKEKKRLTQARTAAAGGRPAAKAGAKPAARPRPPAPPSARKREGGNPFK
jgi:hypothetical protein